MTENEEEIKSLCRDGKSYAVAEAILNLAMQDSEKLVEATKREMPRILADHLKRENEQLSKLFRK